MKRFAALPILLGVCFPVCAQQKPGIYNSNYSSTNSLLLNPSSTVDSRTYIQVNLVGVSAYMMNNIMYFPNFSLWNAISYGIEDPVPTTLKLKKFLFANASVDGPSFVISKNNFGAGFFTRARSVAELKRVPYQLTDLFLDLSSDSSSNVTEINLRKMRLSNMTWVEYGGNFGWMIRKRKDILIAAGGSLKYITGINVAYANIIRLQGQLNDASVTGALDARVRYNQPGWATGRGMGVDLGFTYKKMLSPIDNYYSNSPRSNCKYVDYKYKIGVSLNDLGAVRFKKNPTQIYVKGSGEFFPDSSASYEDQFSANFNSYTNSNPIWATLPTALSGQFDYNFENGVYLCATVIKNVVPSRVTGVQAQDMLSVVPRFESKNVEVSLPLTFRKFVYPQLGLAFRVRSCVFGVDNIFPYLFPKNTYGMGMYVSLGFSIFKNPACKKVVRRVDDCASGFSLFKRSGKKREAPAKKKQRLGGKKRRVMFQSND